MTKDEKKKMDMLPDIMRYKLIYQRQGENPGKKERTVRGYETHVKLRSVIRWKERMAKCNISVKKLGETLGLEPIRISEWLNFTHEPTEKSFQNVEAALYKLGA